jgi:uncharacterized protein (DUF2236 family)
MPTNPATFFKHALVGAVRATFNDQQRGETPVKRSEDALFSPDSVTWRVHGDVTTMMVGGVASLLLQMLHPSVLAGVWDHSNFRNDMLGRLRRTARFVAITTYGQRDEASSAIARVRRIHDQVTGVLPNGIAYRANDPAALAWVHATESWSFLNAWQRYAEPRMSRSDQDRYFAEVAQVGRLLGADPVPDATTDVARYLAAMRPRLCVDERTREVASFLLNQAPQTLIAAPAQAAILSAAIDLLPGWARAMHGISNPPLFRPFVRAGTMGLATTLRWAFR